MTTKRLLAAVCGAALAAGLSSQASAATTISVSVSGISHNVTDPGLIISAAGLTIPTFQLNNVNDFAVFDVLTIGTPEGTVNTDFLSLFGEDTAQLPISVSFAFANPSDAVGGPVGGSTFGFIKPLTSCGIIAGGCGAVEWGAPSVFSFGGGGQIGVELFDATFATPGTATVKGRFTLLAAAVPEPGTWMMMIMGFGAVGATMRSARRKKVTVSYA